jgi:hypothetical protein
LGNDEWRRDLANGKRTGEWEEDWGMRNGEENWGMEIGRGLGNGKKTTGEWKWEEDCAIITLPVIIEIIRINKKSKFVKGYYKKAEVI